MSGPIGVGPLRRALPKQSQPEIARNIEDGIYNCDACGALLDVDLTKDVPLFHCGLCTDCSFYLLKRDEFLED